MTEELKPARIAPVTTQEQHDVSGIDKVTSYARKIAEGKLGVKLARRHDVKTDVITYPPPHLLKRVCFGFNGVLIREQ